MASSLFQSKSFSFFDNLMQKRENRQSKLSSPITESISTDQSSPHLHPTATLQSKSRQVAVAKFGEREKWQRGMRFSEKLRHRKITGVANFPKGVKGQNSKERVYEERERENRFPVINIWELTLGSKGGISLVKTHWWDSKNEKV